MNLMRYKCFMLKSNYIQSIELHGKHLVSGPGLLVMGGANGYGKVWSGVHKYKERVTSRSVNGPYRSKFHFSEVGAVLVQLCYSL